MLYVLNFFIIFYYSDLQYVIILQSCDFSFALILYAFLGKFVGFFRMRKRHNRYISIPLFDLMTFMYYLRSYPLVFTVQYVQSYTQTINPVIAPSKLKQIYALRLPPRRGRRITCIYINIYFCLSKIGMSPLLSPYTRMVVA